MEYHEIIIISRVVTGAICAFSSILLWSKTREPAWILIIVGTLCFYAEIVYSTLVTFGILNSDILSIYGIPILRLLLLNAPLIFITIGFIIMIVNIKRF